MAFILTFLGKGGSGRTTLAISAAKKYANSGLRVLLAGQDRTPSFAFILGAAPDSFPAEIAPGLEVVQLRGTELLEQSWEQVKELEAKYLRSPVIKNIYGQELGLLPGMDEALALNYLREMDESGKYDVIIYDGDSSLNTLRMFGIPNTLSWYFRRVRQTLENSEVIKALSPFVQPVTSAILTVSWSADDLSQQQNNQANQILDRGKAAIADANRVAAFLVTTQAKDAIAAAKYWWGSAQQVGLTVGGLLLNRGSVTEDLRREFNPLEITSVPTLEGDKWQPLTGALPNFQQQASQAPKPLTIDTVNREVKVFLPGFAKKQVKLSQSGPEITIEAGDQRHNIFLPPPLKGQTVRGAKFQNHYLIVSL